MNGPVKDEVGHARTRQDTGTTAVPRAWSAWRGTFAGQEGDLLRRQDPELPRGRRFAQHRGVGPGGAAERDDHRLGQRRRRTRQQGPDAAPQPAARPHRQRLLRRARARPACRLASGFTSFTPTIASDGKIYINGKLDGSREAAAGHQDPGPAVDRRVVQQLRLRRRHRRGARLEGGAFGRLDSAPVREPEAAANTGRPGGAARARRSGSRRRNRPLPEGREHHATRRRPAARRRCTGASMRDGREAVVATDRFAFTVRRRAGDGRPDAHAAVQGGVPERSEDARISRSRSRKAIPEPVFTLPRTGRVGRARRRSRSFRRSATGRRWRPRARAS